MVFGDIHRRRHPDQLCELQIQPAEHPPQIPLLVIVQGQHTDFAAQLAHIRQHLIGGGFPEVEAVPLPRKILHQPGEGTHREVKVLAGHGESLFALTVAAESLLHQLRLGQHLPGIAQKLLTLPGHDDAPVGAGEYAHAHLCLQLPYGGGKAGLGDKQLLGGSADGAAFGYSDGIF